MRTCKACGKLESQNPGITFHRFPQDIERKRIWFSLLGFEIDKALPKSATVCSDHFKTTDFQHRPSGLKYLKLDVNPLMMQPEIFEYKEPTICVKTELDSEEECSSTNFNIEEIDKSTMSFKCKSEPEDSISIEKHLIEPKTEIEDTFEEDDKVHIEPKMEVEDMFGEENEMEVENIFDEGNQVDINKLKQLVNQTKSSPECSNIKQEDDTNRKWIKAPNPPVNGDEKESCLIYAKEDMIKQINTCKELKKLKHIKYQRIQQSIEEKAERRRELGRERIKRYRERKRAHSLIIAQNSFNEIAAYLHKTEEEKAERPKELPRVPSTRLFEQKRINALIMDHNSENENNDAYCIEPVAPPPNSPPETYSITQQSKEEEESRKELAKKQLKYHKLFSALTRDQNSKHENNNDKYSTEPKASQACNPPVKNGRRHQTTEEKNQRLKEMSRIRSKRYRERKRIGAEEEKAERRKELSRVRSKRYRDRKRIHAFSMDHNLENENNDAYCVEPPAPQTNSPPVTYIITQQIKEEVQSLKELPKKQLKYDKLISALTRDQNSKNNDYEYCAEPTASQASNPPVTNGCRHKIAEEKIQRRKELSRNRSKRYRERKGIGAMDHNSEYENNNDDSAEFKISLATKQSTNEEIAQHCEKKLIDALEIVDHFLFHDSQIPGPSHANPP